MMPSQYMTEGSGASLRRPVPNHDRLRLRGRQEDRRQCREILNESKLFKAVKKRILTSVKSLESVVLRFVPSLAGGNIAPNSRPVIRLKVSVCRSFSSRLLSHSDTSPDSVTYRGAALAHYHVQQARTHSVQSGQISLAPQNLSQQASIVSRGISQRMLDALRLSQL